MGHIFFNGAYWNAFDATRLNDTRNGFHYVGAFPRLMDAKFAVEQACGYPEKNYAANSYILVA